LVSTQVVPCTGGKANGKADDEQEGFMQCWLAMGWLTGAKPIDTTSIAGRFRDGTAAIRKGNLS
jgi:hypothetical protein